MTHDQHMTVSVYDGDYAKQGTVGDYQTCSVTWQWLGVGAGTLVVDPEHWAVPLALTANTRVWPVTVEVAGRRWSGRMIDVQRDRREDGGGTATITLVDDWAWLRSILAWPVPAAAVGAQTSMYDTRTGPAATVACQLINANAARLGAPVFAIPPAADNSPTVTVQARMQPVAEYVRPILEQAGWSLDASVWLPGDDPPNNMAMSGPTVIVRPYRVAAKPWLLWSDSVGGIKADRTSAKHPGAYRQVLGGAGEETARIFAEYTDLELQVSLGRFGFPENFADQTDQDTLAGLLEQGPRRQAETSAGSVGLSIDVEDGLPWRFGEHYEAGDVATVSLSGVEFTERITRVTATDSPDEGLLFTPQIGNPDITDSSDEVIVRVIASLARRLTAIQTGR